MRVGVETRLADFDDAEPLKGHPDDRCQCPRWGYHRSGRMTVRYPDREEIIRPGGVLHVAGPHDPRRRRGRTRGIQPEEEFRRTMAVAERNLTESRGE